MVSVNYFSVLASTAAGTLLPRDEDEVPVRRRGAVLGWYFWQAVSAATHAVGLKSA